MPAEKICVGLSADAEQRLRVFEKFLMDNVYLHPSLREAQKQVGVWLERLFDLFKQKPELMPIHYQRLISQQGLERTVIDYIAGMTDGFCIKTVECTKLKMNMQRLIASCFGLGRLPIAPGTWGSLPPVVIFALLCAGAQVLQK